MSFRSVLGIAGGGLNWRGVCSGLCVCACVCVCVHVSVCDMHVCVHACGGEGLSVSYCLYTKVCPSPTYMYCTL